MKAFGDVVPAPVAPAARSAARPVHGIESKTKELP